MEAVDERTAADSSSVVEGSGGTSPAQLLSTALAERDDSVPVEAALVAVAAEVV